MWAAGRLELRAAAVVLLVTAAGCAGASKAEDHDAAVIVGVDAAELGDGGEVDLSRAGDLAKVADASMHTGACNPANETLGAGGGPDVCTYGEICTTPGDQCAAAPAATCGEVSGAPAWDTAAKVAPVIISATAASLATTNSTTECAGGDPAALVTIDFYAPDFFTTVDTPPSFASQLKFKVSTLSTGTWYSANFIRMLPTKNEKFGTFQVGINCGTLHNTAGIYIVDAGGRTSNTACVTW